MSETVTSLKVFVASPSDVKNERAILEQVVDDLNKLIGTRFNRRLDLVKWETDTFPSSGRDAQDVIDEQIGNDYDVFIGILWTRFGTPTKFGLSGTQVEFTHAHQRAKEKPNSVQIMIYFNNAPVSPDALDVTQLSQIKNFKTRLGEEGIYWWQYNGVSDFERFVRLHLGGVMLDFGSKWGQTIHKNAGASFPHESFEVEKVQSSINSSEDIVGLATSSLDDMNIAGESIKYLATFMNDFNRQQVMRTDQLTKLGKEAESSKVDNIVNSYADDIDDLVIRSEAELRVLSKRFRSGTDLYIKFISLIGKDFIRQNESVIKTGQKAMEETREILADAQITTRTLRNNIMKLPRRTMKLSDSMDYFLRVWDKTIEEFRAQELLALEMWKIYKNILGES